VSSPPEPVTCRYIAPGSTTVQTLPAGTVLRGVNQILSQAARWPLFLSWGWKVEAVPLTATAVDITITCVGPPPVALPPPPPPPPTGTVPSITDESGGVWTLGALSTPSGFPTLRDGVQMGGGYGVGYLLVNGAVYVLNATGGWFTFVSGAWVATTDPRIVILPPPPPLPPLPPPTSISARLLFDEAGLAALRATYDAASPDHALWRTWQAGAELLLLQPPQYGYAGDGFPNPIVGLGLAYLVTGDLRYALKVKELVQAIRALGPEGILPDSGYPTRNLVYALAIAYNWCQDAYTETETAEILAHGNAWFDLYKAGRVLDADGPAFSNYFGGHLLGFGLWGLGTLDRNPRGQEIVDVMRARWTSVQTAFSSGIYQGGFPAEGYTYGINHFVRLLQYAAAVKSVTGEDIASGMADTILTSLIHTRLPNRWQFPAEADYAGDYVGIMDQTLIVMLTGLCSPTSAGYAQQFLQTMNANAPQQYPATRSLIWGKAVAPRDYQFPLVHRSPGDGRVTVRTSWADTAVVNTFKASALYLGGHATRSAGHISVHRGDDPLLVNAGQWKGPGGWGGNPQIMDGRSWFSNTLAYPTFWNADYKGAQGYWGTEKILASGDSAQGHWTVSELTDAYNRGDGPSDLQKFIRTQVVLPDGTSVVRDHVIGPSAPKEIAFHAHAAGPWSITGNRAESKVGASQIVVTSLTHPSLSATTTPVSATDPTPTTHRLAITDSAPDATFLHVLQPGAGGVTPVPVSGDKNGVTVGGVSVTFDSAGVPTLVASGPDVEIQAGSTVGPYQKYCALHSPRAGETLIQPVGLRLIATASDREVRTLKVEFYVDDVRVGTVLTSSIVPDNSWEHVLHLTGLSLSVGDHDVWARSFHAQPVGLTIDSLRRRITVVARPTYAATHTLRADLDISVSGAYVGDAGHRILIDGQNQWSLIGTPAVLNCQYVDFVGCGFQLSPRGTVTMTQCRFFECESGTVTQDGVGATASIQANLWASNSRFHLDPLPEKQGSAFCWTWTGSSTGAKVFEANTCGAGAFHFQSANWRIGETVAIGPRIGVWLDGSFSGELVGNLTWHDYPPTWSQGSNWEMGGCANVIARHNVIAGGSWTVRYCAGEFAYNYLHGFGWMEGAIWTTTGPGPDIHHNVIYAVALSRGSIYQLYGATGTTVRNNTIHTPGESAHVAGEGSVVNQIGDLDFDSNLYVEAQTPGVQINSGVVTADYNCWHNPLGPHYSDGRVPLHDVSGDPVLVHPLTTGVFQWDAEAIWLRTTTAAQILRDVRDRYTPRALVLGAGNPAHYGAGNIGAIGENGPSNPFDVFGKAA